jgi:hypothetical protein
MPALVSNEEILNNRVLYYTKKYIGTYIVISQSDPFVVD